MARTFTRKITAPTGFWICCDRTQTSSVENRIGQTNRGYPAYLPFYCVPVARVSPGQTVPPSHLVYYWLKVSQDTGVELQGELRHILKHGLHLTGSKKNA